MITACQDAQNDKLRIDEDYLVQFEKRKNSKPAGPRLFYLQLIGMFELSPLTTNEFGSDTSNIHKIKYDGVPAVIGTIELTDDSMVFRSTGDSEVVNSEGSVISEYTFIIENNGNSKRLMSGNFQWYVTRFGGKYYLRLLDTTNPSIKNFKGFEYYQPTNEFIIEGKVKLFDKPVKSTVPTVLGIEETTDFVGTVSFNYGGSEYKLLMEKGGFIMFADETSGDTTYGAGRYLKIRKPNDDESTLIDFNYAFNPPCSFSDYTTCLFPPKENRLPFKVEAGEKAEKRG